MNTEIPEYLVSLNKPQLDAVLYCEGPELVIAGAGSGKTRVLTYKIVHLLKSGVKPHQILALTFTNKAADEMRERIQMLVGEKTASKIWMGTFHSIFARILRIYADRLGFKSNFTIYDTADSKSLVKAVIKDMNLDDKVYKASSVLGVISTAKNSLISPEMYLANKEMMDADFRAKRQYTQQIYAAYRSRCFASDAMDFDDLLFYTNVLLRDNPDILEKLQNDFRYVLVDEYQDTNFAQHLIVTKLAEAHKRLCVVGDDAQSIYSFRGANINNILNLRKTYPDLALFRLEQNYRSTRMIVNAANSLIAKNSEQIPKTVFSENEIGKRIDVAQCYSDLDEAYMVVNKIREFRRINAEDYGDFAILFRTNAQSRPLEEQLRKYNIPYIIYKGQSFYQRKEIKDAVAYFRLAVNPDDDEALKRVINLPARGIGEVTLKKIQHSAIENDVSMWEIINNPTNYPSGLSSATWNKVMVFRNLILEFVTMEKNQEKDAYGLVEYIMRKSGLSQMVMSDYSVENISKKENLESLVAGVNEFVETKSEEGGDVSLTAYLQQIALSSDQDETENDGNGVKLMTVHSAKGLEFGNVMIVGVEDDLFPSSMSKNSYKELEEERRLLYVAITRAKNYCMMSHAKSRFKNGTSQLMRPSPFLRDIDRKFLRIVSGDDFEQPVYEEKPKPRRVEFSVPQVPVAKTQTHLSAAPAGDYTTHTADKLSVGTKIEHSRFGQGVVLEIDSSSDHKIVVQFNNGESKTLLLKFARFKIIG